MFLTIREVALRLKISASCVYQLIESKRLSHHRIGIGRGAIRVSECNLDDYRRECHCEGTPTGRQAPRRVNKRTLKHIRL
ncbi:MAG: helix-turn-helix domain-containing protein [Planctomycetaceae bacterium]|nr:helix-turn-helix domain-containing protein [Planctomycetaceae bacterium]